MVWVDGADGVLEARVEGLEVGVCRVGGFVEGIISSYLCAC